MCAGGARSPVRALARTAEHEQEEAQRLWEEFLRFQGQQVPEGERLLVTHDALHRQLKRLAMTSAAATYEREHVIGDPNQTFGIEIEFDGANGNAIARALHDAGLASSPRQEGYHSSARVPGKWMVEHDSTVASEVVSRSVLTECSWKKPRMCFRYQSMVFRAATELRTPGVVSLRG